MNLVQEMLLITDPSIVRLYEELTKICAIFIPSMFVLAIVIEFFGEMRFGEVIKRLVIITLFLGSFYSLHTKAVELSMDTAYKTLKKVSPNNIFIKKWYEVKVETTTKDDWGWIKKFAVPNLNDLVATTLFVTCKVCIWLLQLIYSTVYHFTYVFAGFTAVLYFFKWTDKGLVGTIQSSLWCIVMPFVLVAVLAMVGNTLKSMAKEGASIKTIVWLFGVCMTLLITPAIAWGMVKGSGIASSAGQMGQVAMLGMFSLGKVYPLMKQQYSKLKHSTVGRFVRQGAEAVKDRAVEAVVNRVASTASPRSNPWANSYTGGKT